ncbi:MAG: TrbC/VirB2 family protein [Rickettsiales bacterium]
MSTLKLTKDSYWQACLLFCLMAAVMVLPSYSFADTYATGTTDDGISQTLCYIVTKLTGPIGKTIAMIALVVLGIGIFMGKLSWQLALGVAIGITFIFAAGKIVNWLSNTGTDSCSVS